MDAVTSFTAAVREIASGLRESDPSHPFLNRAAGEIDQLGRRLHGLGMVRDREVADCLTSAIQALDAAHTLAGTDRAETVSRAAAHLESAADHAGSGPAVRAP